jgi:hypothetical protein
MIRNLFAGNQGGDLRFLQQGVLMHISESEKLDTDWTGRSTGRFTVLRPTETQRSLVGLCSATGQQGNTDNAAPRQKTGTRVMARCEKLRSVRRAPNLLKIKLIAGKQPTAAEYAADTQLHR